MGLEYTRGQDPAHDNAGARDTPGVSSAARCLLGLPLQPAAVWSNPPPSAY